MLLRASEREHREPDASIIITILLTTTKTTMPEPKNKTDTAHKKELTLVRVARAGNIEAVQSILEAASPSRTDPEDDLDVDSYDPHIILPSVINEAGVWQDIVERDYENVYSWYGVSWLCWRLELNGMPILLCLPRVIPLVYFDTTERRRQNLFS